VFWIPKKYVIILPYIDFQIVISHTGPILLEMKYLFLPIFSISNEVKVLVLSRVCKFGVRPPWNTIFSISNEVKSRQGFLNFLKLTF
jgi:hypothetical protein